MSTFINDSFNILQNVANELQKILSVYPSPVKEEVTRVITETKVIMLQEGRNFVRLAGFSGGLAVAFAAYGSHVFKYMESDKEMKEIYETANKLHFLHTLAMLGAPLTRHPNVVGACMATGIIVFSGSCYYRALTRRTTFREFTAYGGMFLIAGWAAMIF